MEEAIAYGSEKPLGYRPRVVDAGIRKLLDLFGGVEVAGTKWCGKTWSALAFGDDRTDASRNTVALYLDLFRELYFIDELYGWDAPVRSKSRVRTKPKRYFADPSLPAHLLGMSPDRLLRDAQTFGLLFESLCMRDLRVYASALPDATIDPLRYYQDADGLEVDAIIELRDGRWAGVEVKLGESKVPDGIANLNRLRKKVLSNTAARSREPSFMAVVTATSPFSRRDPESGVYVLPITALRP